METKTSSKYIAEFIGTLCLVLFGCGSAVIASANIEGVAPSGIGLLGIALAFGVTVTVMAYAIGPISGCHVNPAISIAMLAAGQLSFKDCVGYVIAQCLGAIAGAGILLLIASGRPDFVMHPYVLGCNGWGADYLGHYSLTAAFLAELVFSFIFLIVIFGTTAKRANPGMAGLAIGLSLTLIHLVVIPITGTSVNPARSLGPALFAGGAALQQLWLFIVAPILGAVTAAVFWKLTLEQKEVVTKKMVDVHEDISINRV
ncbi:aquaporin Z [Deminuibacter soli]|uniref:Aquaporin Z n=1 Tax=Deminuibacter soli TaxID=2291815 RepID=A0A3E1NFQ2_9BACT|nr:aquaporin Z [Deminuibacter soli]RFM26800.1 aquaporin Z [Deminuibacter soli]